MTTAPCAALIKSAKCLAIENGEKGGGGVMQDADALDPAKAGMIEAADHLKLVLGIAHHLADIDLARRAHQADTDAAQCRQAETAERLRPLHVARGAEPGERNHDRTDAER